MTRASSLRAQRSNPPLCGRIVDCFVASLLAMTAKLRSNRRLFAAKSPGPLHRGLFVFASTALNLEPGDEAWLPRAPTGSIRSDCAADGVSISFVAVDRPTAY